MNKPSMPKVEQTYRFTIQELCQHFADVLGVELSKVYITEQRHYGCRNDGPYFGGIEVKVKP